MPYVLTHPTVYRPRGLGQASGAQIGASAGSAAANIAATAMNPNLPTSTKIESGVSSALLTASMIPGPQQPFLAIAAGVSSLLAAMGVGSGCGQTCVISTKYANQAESLLRQNISTYFAQNPRYASAQQAALSNANAILNDMFQQCSNPSLGSAGQRCISDRQAGACTWKATANSPWPGGPAQGACWNWQNAYVDPIINDPDVQPDPVQTTLSNAASEVSSVLGGSSNLLPLLIVGALVAWGLAS